MIALYRRFATAVFTPSPWRRGLLRHRYDKRALERALRDGVTDIDNLEREVRRATGKFVSDRTKRRPMIVPVVMTT